MIFAIKKMSCFKVTDDPLMSCFKVTSLTFPYSHPLMENEEDETRTPAASRSL